MEHYITPDETANRLGLKSDAIRRAIRVGLLKAEKINGRYFITEEAFNEYEKARREKAKR